MADTEIYYNSAILIVQIVNVVIVLGSVIALSMQLSLQRRSHIVSSFEKLLDSWESERMLRLRKASVEYLKSQIENEIQGTPAPDQISGIDPNTGVVLEFFDRLGAYVKCKAIPSDISWEAFSWYIDYYYAITKNDLTHIRKHHDDELLYENFEIIALDMHKINCQKFASPPDVNDLTHKLNFLDDELETINTMLEYQK